MKINKSHSLKRRAKHTIILFTLALLGIRCSSDSLLLETADRMVAAEMHSAQTSGTITCAECTHVVEPKKNIINGKVLGLKPGDVICLDASKSYHALILEDLEGTADNPIIIRNCGGTALIDATGRSYAITARRSRHFRITGGDTDGVYGIRVHQGHLGVAIGGLSTDVEIDHLAIEKSGFAGIMTKTDPNCDPATWRENFVMKNVRIHHNHITETGGEGIYAGNSFWGGMQTDCGVKLPHEIHNIEIHHNIVERTGWEAIQLGCATKGASIHSNIVRDYGVRNQSAQNNGIQVSSGTGGLLYNNLIQGGTGNGIMMFGIGDNVIFNNIIENAGNFGIFADERDTPGRGFVFLNNTIIEPNSDGLRIYAELVPENVFINNIITKPGSGVFVKKLNNSVKITMSDNFFTHHTDSLLIENRKAGNFRMKSNSPVIDRGADVSKYHRINVDFYNQARVAGTRTDIGAVELQKTAPNPGDQVDPGEDDGDEVTAPDNASPEAFAGRDQTIELPVNSVILAGRGTDSDGEIVKYQWSQYGGAVATIASPNSPATAITLPGEGRYFFRLTVTDDKGATAFDNVLVRVTASTSPRANIEPTANAGQDITLYWPANTVTLQGSGNDVDGKIVKYEWTQYSGPPSQILNSASATPTLIASQPGRYFLRLTVTDDNGASASDNMLVRVLEGNAP